MLFALDDTRVAGPLNGTAPTPCTMKELAQAIGRALGRPSWLPVPGPVVRLAFGEAATVLLDGQRVIPELAMQLGYRFRYQSLDASLESLVGHGHGAAAPAGHAAR
jgi:NAD dependent epimerase/dehydratase family enzyme